MAGQVVKVNDEQNGQGQTGGASGQKPKKPIFKKPLFWVAATVVLLLVVGAVGGMGRGNDDSAHAGELKAPIGHGAVLGRNCSDIVTQFEKAGFTNVSSEGLGDLITGLLNKEGEVSEVSIDGKTNYDDDAWFLPDAKVVIRYHSFKSSGAGDKGEATDSEQETKGEKAKVPNVVGKKLDEAESALKDAGFSEFTTVESDGSSPWVIVKSNWVVSAQDPAAGSEAETSAAVTLTVGKEGESTSSKSGEKSSSKKNVSAEYQNALYKAQSYSDNMHMSKKGIYKQLTSDYGEGFKKKAAKYAIKHVKANWKKNALVKAKEYQSNMHMSKSAIYDQLVSSYGEQFTAKEAKYAIKHL